MSMESLSIKKLDEIKKDLEKLYGNGKEMKDGTLEYGKLVNLSIPFDYDKEEGIFLMLNGSYEWRKRVSENLIF